MITFAGSKPASFPKCNSVSAANFSLLVMIDRPHSHPPETGPSLRKRWCIVRMAVRLEDMRFSESGMVPTLMSVWKIRGEVDRSQWRIRRLAKR